MLRPDLFESVDLKNAVSQIMCMSRKSDLEYYETDPVEMAKVPDAKVIDSLLMRRQHMFRPPPEAPSVGSVERLRAAAAAAAAGAEGGRRSQSSAGRSRYLLVNASNSLVSSFNHISMREGELSKGKYVTLTFHVRQPNWFDQLKQVYVNAKCELDKLIAFMRRLRCEENSGEDIDFQDFVKAERDLVYSERNLRQWVYKFDVELRKDSLMRHAIEAFQCRLGLDGCDNLGYSFGLFLDECLCTNETAPRQVVNDSTPANYKIADRADIFVTNYFAMTANRAFREEVVSVLYEVYVKDSAQQQQQQQQNQMQQRSHEFGHVWGRSEADNQQQQQQQLRQQQQQLKQQLQQQLALGGAEFAPSHANTLTHYEKPQPRAGALSRVARQSVGGAGSGGGGAVRIQVPNSRKVDEAGGDSDTSASAASAAAAKLARSQLLYVGNS